VTDRPLVVNQRKPLRPWRLRAGLAPSSAGREGSDRLLAVNERKRCGRWHLPREPKEERRGPSRGHSK
jgi:hypothetical protein